MSQQTPPGSVVITGASTGIGRACALRLDTKGIRVFAGVRREEDGAALRRKGSELLTPVLLDVTDADMITSAREIIADAVGDEGLTGVVNNAGVYFGGPLEFISVDGIRDEFEVNRIPELIFQYIHGPLDLFYKFCIIDQAIKAHDKAPFFKITSEWPDPLDHPMRNF